MVEEVMLEETKMRDALKTIAVVLHYPDITGREHIDEMLLALQDAPRFSSVDISAAAMFLRDWANEDLLDLQAEYVNTFDRGRHLSLYLFEHVHGESRDRGQAMVDLLAAYRAQGLLPAANELPDYLPLFLEFCASLPTDDARGWLQDVGHLLQLLHARLVERGSRYQFPMSWLLHLAELSEAEDKVKKDIAHEARDDTPQALDQAWAEVPVMFGGDAAAADSCASARLPPRTTARQCKSAGDSK